MYQRVELWRPHFPVGASGPGSRPLSSDGLLRLPPAGETHRHLDWYQRVCLEGRDMTDVDWRALKIFLTRSADIG